MATRKKRVTKKAPVEPKPTHHEVREAHLDSLVEDLKKVEPELPVEEPKTPLEILVDMAGDICADPAVPKEPSYPKLFKITHRDTEWTGCWWNPKDPLPPEGSPIAKGRVWTWCVIGGTGSENRIRPGQVIMWAPLAVEGRVALWVRKSAADFQRSFGTGIIPDEPPYTRKKNIPVTGPGRG